MGTTPVVRGVDAFPSALSAPPVRLLEFVSVSRRCVGGGFQLASWWLRSVGSVRCRIRPSAPGMGPCRGVVQRSGMALMP